MKTVADLLAEQPYDALVEMSTAIDTQIEELLIEKRLVDVAIARSKRKRGGRPRKETLPVATPISPATNGTGQLRRVSGGHFAGNVTRGQLVALVCDLGVPVTAEDVRVAFANRGVNVTIESMRVALGRASRAGQLHRLDDGRFIAPDHPLANGNRSDTPVGSIQTIQIEEPRHPSRD
jgi:hypothetical protein